MRIESNKIYLVIIFLMGILSAFAETPPMPLPMGRKKPPSPPGLPIDENILIVMIFAVFFGAYIIYGFKFKTKTPI